MIGVDVARDASGRWRHPARWHRARPDLSPAESRFQFVDDRRDTYEVKRLCQVLNLNRSSYFKWLVGAEARAARQHKDRVLA